MLINRRIKDEDIERMIGKLLRTGVLLSLTIVLTGGIVYLVRHGGQRAQFDVFRGEPDKMKMPGAMWQAIWHGEGRPLIAFGLLVLILTPIARIIVSVVGYVLEKDYLYILITLFVLTIILWNFKFIL
jgi:uncharacterized membrane protein